MSTSPSKRVPPGCEGAVISYRPFCVMTATSPSLIADCLMLTSVEYGPETSNHHPLWPLPGLSGVPPSSPSWYPGHSRTQDKPLASPRASDMRVKATPRSPNGHQKVGRRPSNDRQKVSS